MTHIAKTPMKWRNFAPQQAQVFTYQATQNEVNVIRLRHDFNIAVLGAIPVDNTVIASNGFQGGFQMTPASIISYPQFGQLEVNWNTIDLDYTPDLGYTGPDCFVIALTAQETQQSYYYKFFIQVGPPQEPVIEPPQPELQSLVQLKQIDNLTLVGRHGWEVPLDGVFLALQGETITYSIYEQGGGTIAWIFYNAAANTIYINGFPDNLAGTTKTVFVKAEIPGEFLITSFDLTMIAEIAPNVPAEGARSEWFTYEYNLGYWYNNQANPTSLPGNMLPQYASWDTTDAGDPDTWKVESYGDSDLVIQSINGIMRSSVPLDNGKYSWEIVLINGEKTAFGIATDTLVPDPTRGVFLNASSGIYPTAHAVIVLVEHFKDSNLITIYNDGVPTTYDLTALSLPSYVYRTHTLTCTFDSTTNEFSVYYTDTLLDTITAASGQTYRAAIFGDVTEYYTSGGADIPDPLSGFLPVNKAFYLTNLGHFGFTYDNLLPVGWTYGISEEVPEATILSGYYGPDTKFPFAHQDQVSCENAGYVWFNGACYPQDQSTIPQTKIYQATSEDWCTALGGIWDNHTCWRNSTVDTTSCTPLNADLLTLASTLPAPNYVDIPYDTDPSPYVPSRTMAIYGTTGPSVDAVEPEDVVTTNDAIYRISADMLDAINPNLKFNAIQLKLAIEDYFIANYPIVDSGSITEAHYPYVSRVEFMPKETHYAYRSVTERGRLSTWRRRLKTPQPANVPIIPDFNFLEPGKMIAALGDLIPSRGREFVIPGTSTPTKDIVMHWAHASFFDPTDKNRYQNMILTVFPKIFPEFTFSFTTDISSSNFLLHALSYEDMYALTGNSRSHAGFTIDGIADVWIGTTLNGNYLDSLEQTFHHEIGHALGLSHPFSFPEFKNEVSVMNYYGASKVFSIRDICGIHLHKDNRIPNNMLLPNLYRLLAQGNYGMLDPYRNDTGHTFDLRDDLYFAPWYDFRFEQNFGMPIDQTININPNLYTDLDLVVTVTWYKAVDDPTGQLALPHRGDPTNLCP